MFVTLPPAQAGDVAKTFPDGTEISIKLGTANATADLYGFTTGTESDVTPYKIYLHVSSERVFVNTSVRLLNRFDILYDADGGYFGVRTRGEKAEAD